MGAMSKQKGKRGELEAAALLREYGFEAERGQQYKGGPGSPDLVHSIPYVHIEVKRAEKLDLYGALDQAAADAGDRGKVPLVLHRKNDRPWIAVLYADDLLAALANAEPGWPLGSHLLAKPEKMND